PTVATDAVFGIASVVGLGIAILALFLFGWLADEMLEGDTLAFDMHVRAATHAIASPGLTDALRLVSRLGGPSVLGVLGALLAAAFLWRRWWRGGIVLLVAMAGAGVLDTALKLAFRRTRPTPYFGYALPDSYSFPSGHALFAFCFFTAGAALLAPRLQHPALRVLVWAVAASLVVAIGFSRIYLGVHYPSDVLAGYTVGLLWSSVLIVGDRMARARARRRGGA
ncbi:MAG: phosphatase PAP2 family protein, partial [Gemmatimonadales bacterium]